MGSEKFPAATPVHTIAVEAFYLHEGTAPVVG